MQAHNPAPADIRLDSLSDGPGILLFNLGSTKIISHDHTFLQEIELSEIERQIDLTQTQLTQVANKIPNHNFPMFKGQILHLFTKINKTKLQLATFEPKRVKRGLFNPLGTFIKSITGNLDNDDVVRIENSLKSIQNSEQDLSNSFNKHISLYKDLTFQQTQILGNLTLNQKKLEILITLMANTSNSERGKIMLFAQISQIFNVLSENIQELFSEMTRLENLLAFSRTNSMHHSVLSISDLSKLIIKLKELYGPISILDLDIRNYYDIITLGSYFVGRKLVIVLKFPILIPSTYDLYKLNPVPNKNSLIIIPPFPFIATNSQEFVYMEAECPKFESWYVCKQKTIHQTRTKRDCITRLVHEQEIDATCHFTPISLAKEALLELDSQHYVIVFPKKTRVRVSCGKEEYRFLEGSFIATIPRNCSIKTPEFTIINIDDKIRGYAVEIMTAPKISSSSNSAKHLLQYNLTSIDLNTLHDIQHQVLIAPPVTQGSADFASTAIYHTTIPTYLIMMLSAGALICAILYRRYKSTRIKSNDVEISLSSRSSQNTNATLDNRKAATFALDIGK